MSERKRAVVQEVTDGDTFSTSVRIRLARVEAPELGQPNGTVAKKKLLTSQKYYSIKMGKKLEKR